MEDAPLNLAHFYERKSNKFLKSKRFDDAIECLQISLEYIEEAFKTVHMPKAIEVLMVQKDEYKRQIKQIDYKKTHCESKKQLEDHSKENCPSQEEIEHNLKTTEIVSTANRSYKDYVGVKTKALDETTDDNEYKIYEDERRLLNLELRVSEIPNLAPLELPNFDFQMFQQKAPSKISADKS